VVYRGSRTDKGTGARVYCDGTRRKLSFSLGQYTTIFQAEVYAIKACAVENLDRNYRNRNICIPSDSQAAIKALGKHQITSKLVWDCHQSLIQLAEHNRVQLIRVPGHEVLTVMKRQAVRDWRNRNHKKYWESTTGLKQAKGFISGPSAR
jgi:ribonuclease HI